MAESEHTRRAAAEPFRTLDGSTIRELMHPAQHACLQQSLAEATVPPGRRTALHRHLRSEELYHVTRGRGRMRLGQREFEVGPGDTVAIAPRTPHRIEAIGPEALVFLCCCAPAYDDADTELLE